MNQDIYQQAVSELFTVDDFLRWSVSRFNEAELFYGHGTDNPWDEALALIAFSLNIEQQVFDDIKQCRLTSHEKITLVGYIQRRIDERIPAAYITNRGWFNRLPFYIDERVLVPRSPISELIQNGFQPWFGVNQPQRILDLCTGSGCIAIACALAFSDAEVDAADISYDALAVAQINVEEYQLEEQVFLIQSDVFSGLTGQRYDLIVSNPPYVDVDDLSDMPAEFHHEPDIGLGSGCDGLDITRQILKYAAEHLDDNGVLVVEVGNSQQHLVEQFPDVPFDWPTFANGGHGVFVLTKAQLDEYHLLFS